MQSAPAFRISVWPFGSGRDPNAVTLHVHQVVGPEPVYIGTKGQPLTPLPTITLPELMAEVERVVASLGGPNRAA